MNFVVPVVVDPNARRVRGLGVELGVGQVVNEVGDYLNVPGGLRVSGSSCGRGGRPWRIRNVLVGV